VIRKLSWSEVNAPMIAQTTIPLSLVETVGAAPAAACFPKNSAEEFCHSAILNLAQWSLTHVSLLQAGVTRVVAPRLLGGNIAALRSTMICAFLNVEWKTFPDGGIPAALCVSELTANILEKGEIRRVRMWTLLPAVHGHQSFSQSRRNGRQIRSQTFEQSHPRWLSL